MEKIEPDNREKILAKYEVARGIIFCAEADMGGQTTLHWDTLQDFLAGHKLLLEDEKDSKVSADTDELETLRETVEGQAKIIQEQAITLQKHGAAVSKLIIVGSKAAQFSSDMLSIAKDMQITEN